MSTRRDEMTNYLISQKPRVIERFSNKLEIIKFKGKENFEDLPFISLTGGQTYGISENTGDRMNDYLQSQTPTVVTKETAVLTGSNTVENFTEEILIPPLNTDIRFSAELPEHDPSDWPDPIVSEHSYPYITMEDSKNSYRPREYDYDHRHKRHPFGKYIYDELQENFSWAVPTSEDTVLDLVKKSLIHGVSAQHACGSCWFPYFNLNNSLFIIIKKYYDE